MLPWLAVSLVQQARPDWLACSTKNNLLLKTACLDFEPSAEFKFMNVFAKNMLSIFATS